MVESIKVDLVCVCVYMCVGVCVCVNGSLVFTQASRALGIWYMVGWT